MGYRLNLNEYRLYSGDSWIPLTNIEAGVLRILMRWPGQVKTRDQILEAAWKHNTEAYDRSVDYSIGRIRKKARSEFGEFDAIRTIHGVGYIFEGDGRIIDQSEQDVATQTFDCVWVPRDTVDEMGRRQYDCDAQNCDARVLSQDRPDTCLKVQTENLKQRRVRAQKRREVRQISERADEDDVNDEGVDRVQPHVHVRSAAPPLHKRAGSQLSASQNFKLQIARRNLEKALSDNQQRIARKKEELNATD